MPPAATLEPAPADDLVRVRVELPPPIGASVVVRVDLAAEPEGGLMFLPQGQESQVLAGDTTEQVFEFSVQQQGDPTAGTRIGGELVWLDAEGEHTLALSEVPWAPPGATAGPAGWGPLGLGLGLVALAGGLLFARTRMGAGGPAARPSGPDPSKPAAGQLARLLDRAEAAADAGDALRALQLGRGVALALAQLGVELPDRCSPQGLAQTLERVHFGGETMSRGEARAALAPLRDALERV